MNERAASIIRDAAQHSAKTLRKAGQITDSFLAEHSFPPREMCLVAVGSVGRHEALSASDLDVIPITESRKLREQFAPLEKRLRERLASSLGMKVSRGEELTALSDIESIADPETIGGKEDSSAALTRRVLVELSSSLVYEA